MPPKNKRGSDHAEDAKKTKVESRRDDLQKEEGCEVATQHNGFIEQRSAARTKERITQKTVSSLKEGEKTLI